MPHVFDHGSIFKLVSATGLAPAVTRSQAEHVAATPRAVAPANGWYRGLGSCGGGNRVPWNTYSTGDLTDPKGVADNKEQTPLGDLLDPNPRFHGGCFGVWGTPPPKPLICKIRFALPGCAIGPSWAHQARDESKLVFANLSFASED